MTNHWIDLKNADVILVMGANPASNHPISMKWIMRAKRRGARLLVVDPRFTKTALNADVYSPLRSGTDIAFLGGMIRYIIANDLHHRDYVAHYTNASFLVNPDFRGPGELDGLFSGYDEKARTYDRNTWTYLAGEDGIPEKDLTLESPNCVFQLLKHHYARYTLDRVSDITGAPREKLEEIYRIFGATGRPDRVGTACYAMGWTQHTTGTQNIRTMAIIQLLLGNIGLAGGGVNALRGESNVQGSTDHGLLYHVLPGYLPVPRASWAGLSDYISETTPRAGDPRSVNWWTNRGKYIVSYLKAIHGDAARKENDFGYAFLPKLDMGMNASWLMLFDRMRQGEFEGFFAWGQNPACSGADAGKVRTALSRLKWMVNVNLFDNETGSFWKGPGVDPATIGTEVFFLPCASSLEKEGSITNSGRWAQWRYKAVEPLGDSKPDAEIMNELFFRVKALYVKEGGKFPEPIVNLTWNYGETDAAGKVTHVNIHAVAREINGYYLDDVYDAAAAPPGRIGRKGDLCASFGHLRADGATASGNWIYAQSYTQKDGADINMMARRGADDPTGLGVYPEWSWAWPLNRRIIYNRASVDRGGNPWDPKRAVVKWEPDKGIWSGDVPDGSAPPMGDAGKLPFIMLPHGVASLFGPGLVDGPFPEHYEAMESPLAENILSRQRNNPAVKLFKRERDAFFSADARYPFVATTYRVTEHWQTGVMTRHTPWLLEMMPQLFVEMSKELASEKGIQNGQRVKVSSGRGDVTAVAVVTGRLKPFIIGGRTVHQVALPWCFGWQYPNDPGAGDSANLLTSTAGDPNTMIPETKAFMVNVEKA